MGRPLAGVVFDTTYYPVAVASCALCLTLFRLVSPRLSSVLCTGYRALPAGQQIDWNTRIVSSIHATVVSTLCVYALLYDDGIHNDPLWCDSPLVRTSCAILVGYGAADMLIMAVHYKHIGDVSFFLHHVAAVYAYYYAMTYGMMPYFANYRLMSEFSTVFVNLRWHLTVLGYSKTSTAFIVNGLAMAFTFFAARVAVMPIFWLRVYSLYGTEPFARLGYVQIVMVVTCVTLDVVNLFWFYKICNGAYKVLRIAFGSGSGSRDREGLEMKHSNGGGEGNGHFQGIASLKEE